MDKRYNDLGFPKLKNVKDKKTSEKNPRYNCIAWAFKDSRRWWWPAKHPKVYWPLDIAGKTKLEAFEDWFSYNGWEETNDQQEEAGFEKIALFGKDGEPTHAARLAAGGKWTSKLGKDIDLAHDINDLDGPAYGRVIKTFKKPI